MIGCCCKSCDACFIPIIVDHFRLHRSLWYEPVQEFCLCKIYRGADMLYDTSNWVINSRFDKGGGGSLDDDNDDVDDGEKTLIRPEQIWPFSSSPPGPPPIARLMTPLLKVVPIVLMLLATTACEWPDWAIWQRYLATNFLSKVAKNIWWLLGYF